MCWGCSLVGVLRICATSWFSFVELCLPIAPAHVWPLHCLTCVLAFYSVSLESIWSLTDSARSCIPILRYCPVSSDLSDHRTCNRQPNSTDSWWIRQLIQSSLTPSVDRGSFKDDISRTLKNWSNFSSTMLQTLHLSLLMWLSGECLFIVR